MKGGKQALWEDENIADSITCKAVRFIENHKDEPFFLYVGTNDAHVPVGRIPVLSARAAWALVATLCCNSTGP